MRGPAESSTWSEVEVRQVGSGYNDYWHTPAPEERFVFTKTRYGGLEALADEDILATDTAKLVGGAGEAVRVRRRMRRPTWNRGGDAVDMPLADIVPSSKPDYDNAWSELHLDPFGTDPNAEVDWTKVRRYVRISKKEPATVVMRDGTAHLLDGYHRFVANKLAGEKTMRVEVVPDGEANGAAEDVIKLDRDAVYKGAERVVQAYARTLKRVPFDKGAEAVLDMVPD